MNPQDNSNQDQSSNAGLLNDANFPSGIIKPRMLAADPTQAAGDLYYVNSSGIFQRLAAGSAGQVLIISSGIPSWVTSAGNDGWISDTHTWVYASASTFTIVGVDLTAVFSKGTRLRFTQSATVKYAVVISSTFSTDTTVTIAVNTDYTIANATISANSYSYEANPQGYPGWFNFTPTYTGFSANPAAGQMRYSILGTTCIFSLAEDTGTSNSASFTFTLPVTVKANSNGAVNMPCKVIDNGTHLTTPGLLGLAPSAIDSAVANVGKDLSTAAANAYAGFTSSGAKSISGMFSCQY